MNTETVRHEFGAVESRREMETAIATVTARETALVQARFVMAERHQRNWADVRVRLLQHCDRGGFAEIARYKKPAGKKQINGQYVDTYAEGFSARFAEVARQELGNLISETTVTYEDDRVRVIRATVLDLERNNSDSRDLTVPKVVEKRGKKDKQGNWQPPDGREVISQRINSYGDPVYLCKATDDEVRMRQNSEISKAQRDETTRMIPKDILDDCHMRIIQTMNDPKKIDPGTALKRVIDGFATLNLMPSDLVTYIGCPLEKASPRQVEELRGLWIAISNGEITFDAALKMKYDTEDAPPPQTQDEAAAKKIAEMQQQRQTEQSGSTPAAVSTLAGQSKTGMAEGAGAQAGTQEQAEEQPATSKQRAFGGFGGGKK